MELANGATAEELKKNRYYDAEAIHFIEEVCTFFTLDAAHRQVVSPLRFHTTCTQAISKLNAALDPAAPSKVLCWVVDDTLDKNVLWKLSWASNSVGHSIVPISTYDWLVGVKHARSMM